MDGEIRLKRPAFSSIEKGRKYFAHICKEGECKASAPCKDDYGKGRKAFYVDVFGYGFTGRVLTSKLRVAFVVLDNA